MLIHKFHAVLRRGLEKSLAKRNGLSTAGTWHGHSILCENQTRTRCVIQMGKTQSRSLTTLLWSTDLATQWKPESHSIGLMWMEH